MKLMTDYYFKRVIIMEIITFFTFINCCKVIARANIKKL